MFFLGQKGANWLRAMEHLFRSIVSGGEKEILGANRVVVGVV
jgi:hypothetical protein